MCYNVPGGEKMKISFEINEDLFKRFDIRDTAMALQLTGENESLMKAYVVQTFSQTASSYQTEIQGGNTNRNFEKAIHKIPKWAAKPRVTVDIRTRL